MKKMTRWMLCLPLLAGFTGCATYQSSYLLEPEFEPELSLNAVASADGDLMMQPYSLVAADSVGLHTFGYEIAMWDTLYSQPATASAK